MCNADLVVSVSLPHPSEIHLEPPLALPALNGFLHCSHIRRERNAFAIPKPYVIVGLAFDQLNALRFKGRVKVGECFFE
jgi:hypothetical protein